MLIGALTDLAMRYTPLQIAAGQSFFYWLYVNVFDRLPLALAWMIVLGIVATVGRLHRWIRPVPTAAWGIATLAVLCFALFSPLVALVSGSNVRHMQTLNTPAATYHLYLQPTLQQSCEVILVRCEITCQFMTYFEQPVCLGIRAPYSLTLENSAVIVREADDEVYRSTANGD